MGCATVIGPNKEFRRKMPRKPRDPNTAFGDVLPFWEDAIMNNGLIITVDTEREAWRILNRLNAYRRALRDRSNYSIPQDMFVVKVEGNRVLVRKNEPIRAKITDMEGNPVASGRDPAPFIE